MSSASSTVPTVSVIFPSHPLLFLMFIRASGLRDVSGIAINCHLGKWLFHRLNSVAWHDKAGLRRAIAAEAKLQLLQAYSCLMKRYKHAVSTFSILVFLAFFAFKNALSCLNSNLEVNMDEDESESCYAC